MCHYSLRYKLWQKSEERREKGAIVGWTEHSADSGGDEVKLTEFHFRVGCADMALVVPSQSQLSVPFCSFHQ